MTTVLRRVVAPIIAVGVVAIPASAGAEPPETTTETGRATETFFEPAPSCDEGGELLEITIDFHYVEHSTISSKGEHFTFTNTGTFVAVGSEGTGSGRFTQWGGFNANPSGVINGTFTFSVRGVAPDGSRINFHLTDHFNVRPDGVEHAFTFCRD